MNSDELFWLDPWSAQGQEVSAKLLPQAHGSARFTPSTPSCCWPRRAPAIRDAPGTDALTAMDLGARRLDFIGLKFQLAQEIADALRPGRCAAARQDAAHG